MVNFDSPGWLSSVKNRHLPCQALHLTFLSCRISLHADFQQGVRWQGHCGLNSWVRCIMITARGNAQEAIYRENSDRELFLTLLQNTVNRYNWYCHAYCLMSNLYSCRHPKKQKQAPVKPLAYFEERYQTRDERMAQAYLSGHYTLGQVGQHF